MWREGREVVGGQEAAKVVAHLVAPDVAPDVARWGDELGADERKSLLSNSLSLLPSHHHAQVPICVCVRRELIGPWVVGGWVCVRVCMHACVFATCACHMCVRAQEMLQQVVVCRCAATARGIAEAKRPPPHLTYTASSPHLYCLLTSHILPPHLTYTASSPHLYRLTCIKTRGYSHAYQSARLLSSRMSRARECACFDLLITDAHAVAWRLECTLSLLMLRRRCGTCCRRACLSTTKHGPVSWQVPHLLQLPHLPPTSGMRLQRVAWLQVLQVLQASMAKSEERGSCRCCRWCACRTAGRRML